MSTAAQIPSLLAIALLPMASTALAQARVVINNNAWLRIDNGAWVVVEEPTNAGIQTLGTGGNIRSEGEFNRIRWQIRNSTGVYTIPFTTANGVKMPFTYEAIGGASNEAQASICFSTYNYGAIAGNNWDNNLYRPSDVTHMHNFYVGPPSSNNSDNVVDRFWLVDPYAAPAFTYSAKPSIRLGFTVDPGAATGDVRTGNAITGASTVGAQRFNPGPQWWGDYWPQGTFTAGGVNTVTNVDVMPADFFRSWTLSNILQPLPVELLRFAAACDGGRVVLTWTTASERDAQHFIVERSIDGESFEPTGQVTAVGNSYNATDYTYTDRHPSPSAYYRLRIVDADGTEAIGPVRFVACGSSPTVLVNAWDNGPFLQVVVVSPREQIVSARLFDAAGKLTTEAQGIGLADGLNTFSIEQRGMAMGIYVLQIQCTDGPLLQRVALY
ncbi:MAG TPA: hypothetical protein PKY96_03385 [Flavobacteriales bacterium]|nr:hypothetical protein [Flavobacteriales bacterium]